MVPRIRAATTVGALAIPAFVAACTISPEPFDAAHQIQRARADMDVIRSVRFVPTGPISLHEAMARAVVFNLKRRVSQIESKIAETELEHSKYELLPELQLNADRTRSDVRVSPSEDRIINAANATFVWNFLDLGVSYARAKQSADQVLIARERERKALQDIIRDVNTTFWRVATGQRLMERVRGLAAELQRAIKESRNMERTGTADVLTAVAFRRDVVNAVRQSLSVQRDLNEAKTQLAELLNIRPGTDFTLALPAGGVPSLSVPMSVAEMEDHALRNRPELRIEDYNERISEWEAREAFNGMLPGVKFDVGPNYSSNSTNLSPNWLTTGLHLGMNLFNLFSGTSQMNVADRKGELARQQRLAMSLAVLTELHLARIKYNNASQQMRLAREVADSDRRLTRLVRSDGDMLNHDLFEAVRVSTQELRSEMDEQLAFIDEVSAHAELMHAIGLDTFPDKVPLNDVAALSEDIRKMMAGWESSRRPARTAPQDPIDHLVEAMVTDAPHGGTGRPAVNPRPEPNADFGPPTEMAVVSPELIDRLNRIAPASGGDALSTPVDDFEWDLVSIAARTKNPRPTDWDLASIAARSTTARPTRRAPAIDRAASTEAAAKRRSGPQTGEPGYIVSLGAFEDENRAVKLLADIMMQPVDTAGDVDLRIAYRRRADGIGRYYVMSGVIPGRARAQRLCGSLKRAGRSCQVLPGRD